MTFREEQRLDWQKDYLKRLCETDQEIAQTSELIATFTRMLRERQGEQLDSRLKLVEERGVSELRGFAQSLKKDYDAVYAGLTQIWSQGQVHRLKFLKRQAYSRARLETLRKRVLRRA